MTDKLITHEEARDTMMKIESYDAYYGELQEEHKLMATYIAQQEQFAKDVDRYFELANLDREATHEETKEFIILLGKFTKGVTK